MKTSYTSSRPGIQFGNLILARRLALGLSRAIAAAILGVNPNTLEDWEHDRYTPRTKRIPKIIAFWGYDPFPTGKTLGEQLFHFRMTQGWSLCFTAERLCIDNMTLTRWDTGVNEPTTEHQQRIRELLDSDKGEVNQ